MTGAPSLCPLYIEGPGVDLTVIDCPVGIDENQNSSAISVYPNPTSDKIKMINQGQKMEYIVTDALGKIVVSGISETKETEIDLQAFASGIYFLKSGLRSAIIIKQ